MDNLRSKRTGRKSKDRYFKRIFNRSKRISKKFCNPDLCVFDHVKLCNEVFDIVIEEIDINKIKTYDNFLDYNTIHTIVSIAYNEALQEKSGQKKNG